MYYSVLRNFIRLINKLTPNAGDLTAKGQDMVKGITVFKVYWTRGQWFIEP
jgi:hypothetical protein